MIRNKVENTGCYDIVFLLRVAQIILILKVVYFLIFSKNIDRQKWLFVYVKGVFQ